MVTRLLAVVLLLGSLLPWPNWIPDGESDAQYLDRLADWGLGFALCAAVGVLAWFVSQARARAGASRVLPQLTRGRVAMAWTTLGEQRQVVFLCAVMFVVYAAVALAVFSGSPLLIDEVVQLLQAQDLAALRLTHEIPAARPFFSVMHEVDFGARAYGQFPIGGPAMLTLGVWLRAPWLVGPLVGTASTWLFWMLLRELEPTATTGWRVATTALFALAPFAAFMYGSHMNHASALLWCLVATVALARALKPDAAVGWGLLSGVGLGVAAAIRPLDAVAFALPSALWLLWRSRRGGRATAQLLASGLGVALPMLLLFAANVATTGDAFTFGYDLLWGAGHSLGFHSTPWGAVHTPARGVELISLYLTRLNTYLFELPFPSLLLPAAGLWLWRDRLLALDRYLLASFMLVGVGYWAYWHDGFYLGPRFVFAWTPVLVLWTARGWRAVTTASAGRPAVARGLRVAMWSAAAYAVVTLAVVRIPLYRNGLQSMRVDGAAAARANVRNALVLVQESWGAQLLVRMWDVGVPRPDAEVIYRNVDACVLEEALAGLEAGEVRGIPAVAVLQPLMVDSARLVRSDLSPDFTQRRLPGLDYTARCVARLEEDRAGYLLYAPWRLVQDGNVYARWLPGREGEIAAAFPGRAVYRLRRASSAVDARLVWQRLDDKTLAH
jgi:hypothetical protein